MNFGCSKNSARSFFYFIVAVFPSFCGLGQHAASACERPKVVATTTVVADLVYQIAGNRVEIDCLMGPGIDPHSFKATPRDADRLARADIVFASGLHLEGKLSVLLDRLARRTHVVQVADTLPKEKLIQVTKSLYDPHVWFDPILWSDCVNEVVISLKNIDPSGSTYFADRGSAYCSLLKTLDDQIRKELSTIASTHRVMVTSHDAFRYFGRAYGIQVVGIQGTSTESETGLHDINRLVDLVVTRRIPAVFVETSVADRNMTALREGAQARGHVVGLGGRLYSDALGPTGTGAETLEGALRANVRVIVSGLKGEN
ncbi:MAG: zinc ABC transporter substrate-binding protein [Pirellulales bacterium]